MAGSSAGLRSESTAPYTVLRDLAGLQKGDGQVPANAREVRTGDILALLTASNKFIVRRRTLLAATAATGQPVIVLDDAHPFAVGDVIQVEDEAGTHTILSINYTTNTVTLTTNLTGERAADKYVRGTVTGDYTAVAIHVEESPIYSKDYIQDIPPAYAGKFRYSKIRNFDAQARTDLGGQTHAAWDAYDIN